MRGRKPKPTKLKKLEGNPGKRKLNMKEPKPTVSIPSCPAHLKGEARQEWNRIVKELYALGILVQMDRAALASYCGAYGHWVDAEKHLAKEDAVILTDKGNLVQNPYMQIAKRSMDQMVKFAAEFGMTPSSRSRVKVEQADPEEELEKMLFGAAVKVKG
ncbi:phage terminase small subunit P27 family [Chloroflexi bacterium CFX6]|nr:phage terminase small subunit P27 family [Chloroflexi bacterium CFX6]